MPRFHTRVETFLLVESSCERYRPGMPRLQRLSNNVRLVAATRPDNGSQKG